MLKAGFLSLYLSLFLSNVGFFFFWLCEVFAACQLLYLRLEGSRVRGLSCLGMWDISPQLGIKFEFPALEGGFLTTGPRGKSQELRFLFWEGRICFVMVS